MSTPARPSGPQGTQAIDRALAVLSSFVTAPEQGISEIAVANQLSPSTTHRIARALVTAGYLEQNAETERYRLGHSAVVLGQSAREAMGFDQALPILERLGAQTGESVNLGIRDGNEVVVILRVESEHPLRFDQPPGTRIPIHCSSMGKSLMAFGDDQMDELEFSRVTATTIASPKELAAALGLVRSSGYSLDVEESIEGVSCVGAPILDGDGVAIAAIAVQGPTVRMTPKRQEQLAPIVKSAVAEIRDLMRLDSIRRIA